MIELKKVMISPTDRCNLNCKFCWRLEKPESSEKDKELTIGEIKNILEDCKKLNVKTIDFTGGGEPFIREDIFGLIELAKSYGFEVTLTTNASFLTEEKIEELIKLKLDDICFSLESYDSKINDYLRGEGTFEKSIESIKIFNKFKRNYSSKKPIIRVATVITNVNYKDLDGLVDLVSENNITAINFSVMFEWESNKGISMRNEKDVLGVLKKLKNKIKKLDLNSNINAIIKHGLFEHDLPNFCFAPWEMVFINSKGEVLACCTLASYHENIIGNVKKNTFYDIWSGEQMEKFRERIKQKKYFPECKKCLPDFVERYNKMGKNLKWN